MIYRFEIGWRQNLSMASWRLATRFGEAWRGCLASVATREGLARQDSSKVVGFQRYNQLRLGLLRSHYYKVR
jgi:hypothetical protein